jgi:RecA-family ATPase
LEQEIGKGTQMDTFNQSTIADPLAQDLVDPLAELLGPHASTSVQIYKELVEIGAALHWLKPRQKRPIADGWSEAPRATRADLERQHIPGANIGIRLGEYSETPAGYLHLIDLDIRKPEAASAAWAGVRRLVPNLDELPTVISGSGAGRHFYFFSPTPLRSETLAKSEGFSYVFDHKLGREVKKHDWEIDLLGTGKQAVLPPSIHPDTGLPYCWERLIDFDLVSLGIGPALSFPHLVARPVADPDGDDLFAIVKAEPLDLTDSEIDSYIAGLPDDWVEDRDTWLTVGQALSHQYQGGQAGFDKWCTWSRRSKKFNLRDSKIVWRSFKGRTSNPVTFRSVIKAANDNRDPLGDLLGTAGPDTGFFEPVSNWADTPAPPREWLVPEFIPHAAVTLLSGDGGTGKSLIALQLGVAAATGKPWLGQRIDRPGDVLFLSAEDSRDELHRRLESICNGDLTALERLHARSVVEVDPLLATFDRENRMKTTELFSKVHAAVERVRPSLVVLDTLANLHSGDENNKAHAMQFVNRLKGIATTFNCAVLLLTHPSLSGMSNGSGAAGSVGWSNGVRSRLFLSRVKDKDGNEHNADIRTLTTTKSNYGRSDSRIDVRWHLGKFIATGDPFDDIEPREEKADRVFLRLLQRFTAEGTHVSRNLSPSFAPTKFADQPDSEGCSKADLEDAMNRLFYAGRLRNAEHKSKGQLRQHIEEIGQDQCRDARRNAATVAATLPQHPSATGRDASRNGPQHTPILKYMPSALGALDSAGWQTSAPDSLAELIGQS